jgi:hypothetical protein
MAAVTQPSETWARSFEAVRLADRGICLVCRDEPNRPACTKAIVVVRVMTLVRALAGPPVEIDRTAVCDRCDRPAWVVRYHFGGGRSAACHAHRDAWPGTSYRVLRVDLVDLEGIG